MRWDSIQILYINRVGDNMNKKDKRIIQEDIRDLQNLLLIYSKSDNDYKVSEIQKEIQRLKGVLKNENARHNECD